ncbi:MAG: DUF2358 domain-containing protein [Chloroflexaceae bacterium]|nr:DUF2358 domain-containing protein [Chloroflexaceae bacterium]
MATLKLDLSEAEYQAQVEQIMETLRADLPTLFEQDISYDIYTKNIFFQDPVNTFKGKFNYRIIYWTLRFHARLFFTEIFFDLHRVYQAEKDAIAADWTVRGTLRVPWRAKIDFDGNSTYKLTPQGLIYDHRDQWMRSPKEILQQFFRPG